MSPGIQIAMIAVVFASQILVLSFFTPQSRHRLYALMFSRYPQEEYPRLYPVPKERIQRRQAMFRPMHTVIGVAAAIALSVLLVRGGGPMQLARWMLYCLLLQILPLYIAMPWSIRLMRAFRAMPPPSVRTAELRQWRLSDFVSPLWVGLGLAGQLLALVCAAVAYRYHPQALGVILLCVLVSVPLSLRMLHVLFVRVPVRRVDPYMSPADTFRARRHRLQILFRGAALLGGYFALMLLYAAQLIRFDFIYLVVGISIAFQLLGIALVSAQGRDLERRDFSVYRATGSAPGTP